MKTRARIAAAITTAALATMALTGCTAGATRVEHDCHVTGTDNVNLNKGHEYRVYTSNCGAFKVTDSVFHDKWNSVDTWASIRPGRSYDLTVVGHRNGFLSWFPDILAAKEDAK